jgi:hypothetical protein
MKNKVLAAFLFFFVLTPYAFSTNYYINGTTGSDSYDGLYQTYQGNSNGPWKTLSKAASTVPDNANHTISVAAGTYNEVLADSRNGVSPGYRYWLANGTVNITRMNLSGNWIKVEGFTMSNVAYVNSSTPTIKVDGNYNYIRGNTVNNSDTTIGFLIWNENATGCIFENNTMRDIAGTGIFIRGTNHHILNNDLADVHTTVNTPSENGDYVRFFGSGHVFRGNYFHDFNKSHMYSPRHVDCFQTWGDGSGGAGPASNIVIEKNHIFMGTDAGGLQEAWDASNTISAFMIQGGAASGEANNITIRNNIIGAWKGYETGGGGIARYHVRNLKIYNNTFLSDINFNPSNFPAAINIQGTNGYEVHNNITANFRNHHIGIGSYTTGGDIDYNFYWNSSGNVSHYNYTPAAHDISNQNPLFIANGANLHLQSGSPAKDAGATIPGVTDDYDGVSRPQGTGFDIGAYEYKPKISPPMGLRIVN